MDTAWKTRGICISAPTSQDLDLFEEFVDTFLVPGRCNLIVMLMRYRYQFIKHPECVNSNDPLNAVQVKRIVDLCRKRNIRLVPKMNLMGHQSERNSDTMDGLLKGHPELDETPGIKEVFYCRSLCPSHPNTKPIVTDLINEITEAFETDGIHIGMDEVFDIGKCDRCKDIPTYKLFAAWVTALAEHNRSHGLQTLMWGDRLLNGLETGYGAWEASGNFTEPALHLLSRDTLICDWHYEDCVTYPSVNIFADAGYRMLVCPWRYRANAEKFIRYAQANDKGHIEGTLATTWIPSGDIMRFMLRGFPTEGKKQDTLQALSETLHWMFA